MKTLLKLFFLLVLTLGLLACGDSSDDDNGSTEVNEVEVNDPTLIVGTKSVVDILFSFSADRVFDDGDNVVVVVRLPDGISLVEDTSEIDTILGDDSVGARIKDCETGETLLFYDLDENDLIQAENPDGDADARLTFTVEGDKAIKSSVIMALTDNNTKLTCDDVFVPEAIDTITVLGGENS